MQHDERRCSADAVLGERTSNNTDAEGVAVLGGRTCSSTDAEGVVVQMQQWQWQNHGQQGQEGLASR